MDDRNLRLECLKIAQETSRDFKEILEAARKFYEWARSPCREHLEDNYKGP